VVGRQVAGEDLAAEVAPGGGQGQLQLGDGGHVFDDVLPVGDVDLVQAFGPDAAVDDERVAGTSGVFVGDPVFRRQHPPAGTVRLLGLG
jgi:hypothetical protein